MADWVTLDEALFSEVLREIDPIRRDMNAQRVEKLKRHTATVDVSRALVQSLVECMAEDAWCDHAVGICACDVAALHRELELALSGERTCPQCGGDGFLWDQELYETRRAEYDKGPRDWPFEDSEGYRDCERCGKRGVVSI